MLEVLILSLIQGVTEFLPVSSSSHLIITSKLFDFKNQNLANDVSLHIGSFFAVIIFFRKDIFNFLENKILLIKISVGTIPVIIVGYFLVNLNLIHHLRSVEVIGWTTFIFGILLYISDKFKLKKKINNDLNFKAVLFIGFFQVLSLIPGVSRSGITITAARFLKYKRVDAAKISFLLSIPTLGAISIFGIKNLIYTENLNFSMINLYSIFFSFVISFITIKYFLIYIKKFSLNLFVFYRIFIGLCLILFSYL